MLQRAPTPSTGQIVRVRQRTWLVEDVVPGRVAHESPLVRLSCLDDDAPGKWAELLWQHEVDAEIVPEAGGDLKTRGELDEPRMFAAYLNALRWHSVTSTDRRLLQAPFRAGIDLKAYQLEPLRKALELPRVNLFIADDVGLGKTIEAGLILQELLLRQRVDRVLVVCPPAVTLQWREELDQRFGLSFAIYDRDFVADRRRERGWAVNPWTTHPRFIVSYAQLRGSKRKGATQHLELLLSALQAQGDQRTLLIVDECHQVAPSGGGVYPVDSRTTRALAQLVPHFEHRLFLSATPHNGHSHSFTALLHMLDGQRFTRGVPIENATELAPIMVRRLKRDLRATVGGLPERQLVDHVVPSDREAPEILLGHMLGQYDELYRQTLSALSKRERAARGLVVVNLHKRLLSSVAAFQHTLEAHARGATKSLPQARQLPLRPSQDQDVDEDELDAQDEAWMEEASLSVGQQARDLLERMRVLARKHRDVPDARLVELAAWIRQNLCPDGSWNDRRVVVFTEYQHTLSWMRRLLPGLLGVECDGRIDRYTGQRSDTKREELKAAFNTSPKAHPLRVLLCTDAAREGINLQAHCADLFHFDLPWNPSRIEQRNGRIDRVLQPADKVRCHYFVVPDRPEDKVLAYVVRKMGVIRKELGSLSEVISARLAKKMEEGLRGITEQDIEEWARPEDSALRAQQELEGEGAELLRGNLDELRGMLNRSGQRLGYRRDHLEDAVDLGLRLVAGEGLAPASPPTNPPTFAMPALDAGWGEVLDGMRERRPPDLPWWKRPAVKPVAFKAAHRLDAEAVQLHLGHPLVKRLLARFRSQGFAADDLCRATLIENTTDQARRVLAFARLSLFGAGATRLHEQLVVVAARCLEDGVQPYAETASRQAAQVLDEVLGQRPEPHPDRALRSAVARRAEEDYAALWSELSAQAERDEQRAREALDRRGQDEAEAMRAVLERQRGRINAEFAKHAQLQFNLSQADKEQRDQFERDRRFMVERLSAIEGEVASEPARIRASYEVVLRRFEPVGIAYVWPGS